MGLYDSYKLTNSTKTEEFAGGLSANLKEVKADRDQSYLKTLDLMTSAQEKLGTTQYAPTDAGLWQQVSAETEAKINALAERGDLENALPEMYKTASQTAVKLNQLAIRNKQREEFQKSLDDDKLNLSAATKDMHKTDADQANAGAQFDKFGRVTSYVPPRSPVKSVDNVEKVQKALATVLKNPNSLSTMNKEDIMAKVGEKQGFAVGTGESSEWVTPEMIEKAIQSALASDPGWRQSLEQDAKTLTYMDHPEITDDFAEKALNEGIGINFDKARQLVAQGADPKEVVKKVLDQENFDKVYRAVGNYAGTAAFEKNVRSKETTDAWSVKLDEAQKAQARYSGSNNSTFSDAITTPGPTVPITEDDNTHARINKQDDNIRALDTEYKAAKVIADDFKRTPGEREQAKEKMKALQDGIGVIKYQRDAMMRNLNAERESIAKNSYGKSFSELKTARDKELMPVLERSLDYFIPNLPKEEREKVLDAILNDKALNIEGKEPFKDVSAKNMIKAGGLQALISKWISPFLSGDYTASDGTKISGQLIKRMQEVAHGSLVNGSSVIANYNRVIREAAGKPAKAIQTTFMPFVTGDKHDGTALQQVENSFQNLRVVNTDGTPIDPKEKAAVNSTNIKVQGYIPELDKVQIELAAGKDEPAKIVYASAPVELRQRWAQQLAASGHESLAGLVQTGELGRAYANLSNAPTFSDLSPFTGKIMILNSGTKLNIRKDEGGLYAIINEKTGKPMQGRYEKDSGDGKKEMAEKPLKDLSSLELFSYLKYLNL